MGFGDRGPRKGGLIRKGIQGVAGGVGLISESIKARKSSEVDTQDANVASSSNAGSNTREYRSSDVDGSKPISLQTRDEHAETTQHPGQDDDVHPEEKLEDEWNLDDAQDEIIGDSAFSTTVGRTGEAEDAFIQNNPPPAYSTITQLPLPVIIPQRRPKNRSRGFIRAYAPVLENCGIDQSTWLDFLETFQKSSAASPWLKTINLAGIGTMFMPTAAGMVVGYAIQQATKIAIELQARERTNTFLDKTNTEFFRPRGLYCLVVTWNPESTQTVEDVNLTSNIASRNELPSKLKGVQAKYRTSDGNTYGEYEFPEVAPLIFPALDQLAAESGDQSARKKGNIANGRAFVAEYWDRRATAEYAGAHPDSVLANVPQANFQSRYADPNHPAASGSLISFVSGGKLVPSPNARGLIGGAASVIGQAVRGERQGSQWENTNTFSDSQYRNRYSRAYRGRQVGRGGIGLVSTPLRAYKKVLKKNVLYLMVVNMPSEEELATARATNLP